MMPNVNSCLGRFMQSPWRCSVQTTVPPGGLSRPGCVGLWRPGTHCSTAHQSSTPRCACPPGSSAPHAQVACLAHVLEEASLASSSQVSKLFRGNGGLCEGGMLSLPHSLMLSEIEVMDRVSPVGLGRSHERCSSCKRIRTIEKG